MDANEPRLITETGLAARVASVVEPAIEALGFRLVRVRISGRDGRTVQVMAERPDGDITVDECAEVSYAVSPALDVDDPVPGAYNLEISSPGIDRPLVRRVDFVRGKGHVAKIELSAMQDGRRRFRGVIDETGEDTVSLITEGEDGAETHVIAFSDIAEARLVLTDDLVNASLKAAKARGREAKVN